jgi:drug/metabolite transporter (DMT)-like permease
MSGAANLAPVLLALGAAFCFALALILTQYGLRTVPSWRSPLYTIGGSAAAAWLAALCFVDWRASLWATAIFK